MGRRIRIHEDWSDEPCYLPEEGCKFYSPNDYFGGDLKGITEKLPYLASLGIKVIYLNPIFEAASNHRYNTSDYLSIDPILGSEYDFAKLTEKAAEYGISVMLAAFPFAMCGFFTYNGMPAERFLLAVIRSEILCPRTLAYHPQNLYAELLLDSNSMRVW